MRRAGVLLTLFVLGVALWPYMVQAQGSTVTPTPEPLTAPTATLPPTTPIPTVVLQLTDILSTTAQIADQQRDAWALSSPTSPLFLSLGGIVLLVGMILFLVEQVRA